MLKISLAVMYHPSRTRRAEALAERCGPLTPVLVRDPDPDATPSPLRTAKLAWAAAPPDATHHLVLQDDAVIAQDFAAQLRSVVAQRPDHGIALYVNHVSLRNSYRVRRAAALGSCWAPVSRHEYTPTLGFVLPAHHARALATYLRTLPDEFRADDEAVTVFCRKQGIPVTAAVPNLLDHADLPSIAGNDNHGSRHATVFADALELPEGYWDDGTDEPPPDAGVPPFTVDVYDSRCLIRFTRPGTGEPVDHLYGWYWRDWCRLLDVEAEHVVESWRAHAGDRDRVSLEFWAAGYLLGADVSRFPSKDGRDRPALRAAVASWVESGVSPQDEVDEPGRAALIDTCLAGFRASSAAAGSGELIGRMARREAAVVTAVPPCEIRMDVLKAEILFDVLPCPWCRAEPRTRMPTRSVMPYRDDSSPLPVLALLSCEEISARHLLALRGRPPGTRLRTRAAFWAEYTANAAGPLGDDEIRRALTALDEDESMDRVLPVSSRLPGLAESLHFLTAHVSGPLVDQLNRRYLGARLAAVRDLL
ncbi:hypothetical protein ACIA8R_50235 [Nonomuraea sp. NPDC051191]|uniref:hypothetical protein n=1 Tax=Nonomuraea sp. NPDC051191 TaxID=3364372 RepID=UPI003797529D